MKLDVHLKSVPLIASVLLERSDLGLHQSTLVPEIDDICSETFASRPLSLVKVHETSKAHMLLLLSIAYLLFAMLA